MGVLAPTFSSTPFLSIDAAGSEIWTALHAYINGDTHQGVLNNSSGKLLDDEVNLADRLHDSPVPKF